MRKQPRRALIDARRMKFETVSAFAQAIGVNRATAWRWEQGLLDPSRQKAEEVARLLGRTVEELFEFPPVA